MRSTKQQAQFAGLLYLVLGLSAPFGLIYVPGKLFVTGDAVATAANIRASEGLLRLGIASEIFHQVIFVFLVLALYRLFQPVDEGQARGMAVLSLISVPIVFLNVLNEIAAIALVKPADFLSVFDRAQLDALAYVFVRLHGQGIAVATIFWGLWLFPFGWLAIRSGFIPRIFGILLIVAGVADVADALAVLTQPPYAALISRIAGPLSSAELPIMFWLLIRGAATPEPSP